MKNTVHVHTIIITMCGVYTSVEGRRVGIKMV